MDVQAPPPPPEEEEEDGEEDVDEADGIRVEEARLGKLAKVPEVRAASSKIDLVNCILEGNDWTCFAT